MILQQMQQQKRRMNNRSVLYTLVAKKTSIYYNDLHFKQFMTQILISIHFLYLFSFVLIQRKKYKHLTLLPYVIELLLKKTTFVYYNIII